MSKNYTEYKQGKKEKMEKGGGDVAKEGGVGDKHHLFSKSTKRELEEEEEEVTK